ncbi:hypothetical protein C5167_005523 [Papaver somniferum]|uniref:Uncharacterized protein n=1 Tax=Papaver somniferum TaxID=3469 RepID=A0A4Y7JF02_PAPSO|nr:hypothetical protein C5167_005523 [Papaver somniferum]
MLVHLMRTSSASPSNQVQTNAASGEAMAFNGDSSSFYLWLTDDMGQSDSCYIESDSSTEILSPFPSTVTRSMTIAVLYGNGIALPMPLTQPLAHKMLVHLMRTSSASPSNQVQTNAASGEAMAFNGDSLSFYLWLTDDMDGNQQNGEQCRHSNSLVIAVVLEERKVRGDTPLAFFVGKKHGKEKVDLDTNGKPCGANQAKYSNVIGLLLKQSRRFHWPVCAAQERTSGIGFLGLLRVDLTWTGQL